MQNSSQLATKRRNNRGKKVSSIAEWSTATTFVLSERLLGSLRSEQDWGCGGRLRLKCRVLPPEELRGGRPPGGGCSWNHRGKQSPPCNKTVFGVSWEKQEESEQNQLQVQQRSCLSACWVGAVWKSAREESCAGGKRDLLSTSPGLLPPALAEPRETCSAVILCPSQQRCPAALRFSQAAGTSSKEATFWFRSSSSCIEPPGNPSLSEKRLWPSLPADSLVEVHYLVPSPHERHLEDPHQAHSWLISPGCWWRSLAAFHGDGFPGPGTGPSYRRQLRKKLSTPFTFRDETGPPVTRSWGLEKATMWKRAARPNAGMQKSTLVSSVLTAGFQGKQPSCCQKLLWCQDLHFLLLITAHIRSHPRCCILHWDCAWVCGGNWGRPLKIKAKLWICQLFAPRQQIYLYRVNCHWSTLLFLPHVVPEDTRNTKMKAI